LEGRIDEERGEQDREEEKSMNDSIRILQLHRDAVYPPSNGEEVRVWETTKKLSDYGTVWLARPGREDSGDHPGIKTIDINNPFLEYKATRIYAWNTFFGLSSDSAVDRIQARQTVDSIKRRAVDFDVVCCESPQMLRASWRLSEHYDAELLLNKHNAMYDLLDQQLQLRPVPSALRQRAVSNLHRFEQRGIDAADGVVFQSEADPMGFRFSDETTVEIIPNGTDFESIDAGGNPDQIREQFGFSEETTICLFVAAFDYDPNEVAADIIHDELAPELPDIEFLMIGRDPPDVTRENVHAPGFVEDLPGTLAAADIAICPLTMGSGTKLKMLDYLAAGLPIVTTDVGTQGLRLNDGETALIRNSWREFVEAIDKLRSSESLRDDLSANSRALGCEYSWSVLLNQYDSVMRRLLNRNRSGLRELTVRDDRSREGTDQ